MRDKFFLWIVSALFVIAGCTNDEIVNEQPAPEAEKAKLTLTASVPKESPQTRLSLEQQAGGLDIIVKWKAEIDEIKFFFKQGDVLKEGTTVTLTQDAISADGKSATFTVDIPDGIDSQNAYTLYAVHGAWDAYLDAGKINVVVLPFGFLRLNGLVRTPIAGEVEVAAGASIGSINFEHLGALQCLTIKNASDSDFTFNSTYSSLVNEEGTSWFYNYSVEEDIKAPVYDLIGKQVANEFTINGLPSSTTTLHPGYDVGCLFAQWVMPKDIPTPAIRLKLVTQGGDIVSVNSKPARTSALQKGRAYHLYALWDGSKLYFTNASFNPPPVGDLMHADGKGNFIGVVYSKEDGKVYYNSTRDGANTWLGETLLGTGTEARLVIDGNNHPHVVFTTNDGKITYHKHNGTEWSTEYITTNNAGTCLKPDIAVDGNGKAYITYTDTQGQNGDQTNQADIMYATNSSGTFVKTVIYNGGVQSNGNADYYDKGSYVAVNGTGVYYIIAHHKQVNGSATSYRVVIKTPTAEGSTSSNPSDGYDIYDLKGTFDEAVALYKDNNDNRRAYIDVNGNTASFIYPYGIGTSNIVLHGLGGDGDVVGLSGLNPFVASGIETVYFATTVKANTRVALIYKSSQRANVVYTDNADSMIKVLEVIIAGE